MFPEPSNEVIAGLYRLQRMAKCSSCGRLGALFYRPTDYSQIDAQGMISRGVAFAEVSAALTAAGALPLCDRHAPGYGKLKLWAEIYRGKAYSTKNPEQRRKSFAKYYGVKRRIK